MLQIFWLYFFLYYCIFIKFILQLGVKWFEVEEYGTNNQFEREGGAMHMFLGEYQHTIDTKGRLIVPSKFRDNLGVRFIVTKGLDQCLFVYPLSEWEAFEQKLKQLPLTSADARKFVRFFFAGAAECELDNQGRILLPPNLRQYAYLKKDIVSIGVNNRVEIWDRDNWKQYNEEDNFIDNELAIKMENIGI